MTPERFEQFCGQLEKRFKLINQGEDDIEPAGKIVWKIFEMPDNLIRLSLKSSPKFEGEKVLTAKRIGASAHIEKIYSSTETVHTLIIERKKEEEDDWREIKFMNNKYHFISKIY